MGIKKKIFDFFLIYSFFVLTAFFIYKPAFSSYFFQDDWFTLKISRISSFRDFLIFFIPRTDVIYFRPIGMQVYFFIMQFLFGLNALPFRLVSLLIYSLNSLLIYLLLKKLNFSKTAGLFGAFFYHSLAATYIPFFWSATFPFILGPTFFLLSFLFYIKPKRKIASFIFYVLGLLTLEITVILPLIFLLWEIFLNKLRTIKLIIYYVVPLIVLFYLRLVVYPVALVETYNLKINLLATLRNYLLWSFNFPEEIARQFIAPFKLNQNFVRDFANFLVIWFASLVLIFVFLIVIPQLKKIQLFFASRKIEGFNLDCFGISWYFVAMLPLLLFADHTFPYYLPVPFVGLIIFLTNQISYLLKIFPNINKTISGGIFLNLLLILFWFYSALTVVRFNQLTHWAPKRAKLSAEIIHNLKDLRKLNFDKEHKLVFFLSPEYKLALNDQDALQIIFGDNLVKTVYGNETYEPEEKELLIKVSNKGWERLNARF